MPPDEVVYADDNDEVRASHRADCNKLISWKFSVLAMCLQEVQYVITV